MITSNTIFTHPCIVSIARVFLPADDVTIDCVMYYGLRHCYTGVRE